MAHDPGFGGSIGTEPAISQAEIIDLAFKYDTKEMTEYVQEHEHAKKYLRRVLHGEDFEDAEEVVAPPKPTTTTTTPKPTTTTTTPKPTPSEDIGERLKTSLEGFANIFTGTGPGTISHFIETFNPFEPYVNISPEGEERLRQQRLEEQRRREEMLRHRAELESMLQSKLSTYAKRVKSIQNAMMSKINNMKVVSKDPLVLSYTPDQFNADLENLVHYAKKYDDTYNSLPEKIDREIAGTDTIKSSLISIYQTKAGSVIRKSTTTTAEGEFDKDLSVAGDTDQTFFEKYGMYLIIGAVVVVGLLIFMLRK